MLRISTDQLADINVCVNTEPSHLGKFHFHKYFGFYAGDVKTFSLLVILKYAIFANKVRFNLKKVKTLKKKLEYQGGFIFWCDRK